MNDPLRPYRLRLWAVTLFSVVAVVAAGIWAILPLDIAVPSQILDAPSPISRPDEKTAERKLVSAEAFSATIWNPPPVQKPPTVTGQEPPKPPPPPLQLQLVGIIDQPTGRFAALYDADADRLHIVRDGEQLNQWNVEVFADRVRLVSDAGSRELLLDPDGDERS